jgi:hypothetical protein
MPAKLEQVVVAADIGKKRDFTAVAGIEKWQNKWAWPYETKDDGEPYYRLKFIERLPLDVGYDIQVESIKWVYDTVVDEYKEKNLKPDVVVDATGAGTVVLDMIRKVLPAYGIWFHGGNKVNYEKGVYNVPVSDLAMVLQVAMQSKQLTFSAGIPDIDKLKKELLSFTYKTNINTGHTQFEAWRERDHDDQVYAVCCGLWWCERRYPKMRKMDMEAAFKLGDAIRGRPVRTEWIGDKKKEPEPEPIKWAE